MVMVPAGAIQATAPCMCNWSSSRGESEIECRSYPFWWAEVDWLQGRYDRGHCWKHRYLQLLMSHVGSGAQSRGPLTVKVSAVTRGTPDARATSTFRHSQPKKKRIL